MSFTIFVLGIVFTTAAAQVTCPPTGVHYIADTDDCTRCYVCYFGRITHLTCPDGTYFNTDEKACINSDNITCNSITTESSTISTTDYFTVTSTPFTTDSTKPSAESSDTTLPIFSTQPYSEPSTKFTESSTEVTTTSGSTTSPTQSTGLTDESSTVPYSESSTTFTPTYPITFTVITSTQSSGLPDCSDSSNGFFPYPYDCQFYYECNDGIPKLSYCLAGYNWDWTRNSCEPEDEVDCSSISPTPAPTTPAPTTPEPTTPGGVTCPDTPGTTYIAHPYDCAYFYECHNGNMTLLRCGEGELWDKERNLCDLASHVNCGNTTVTEQPESTTEPTYMTKPTTQSTETTTVKPTTETTETITVTPTTQATETTTVTPTTQATETTTVTPTTQATETTTVKPTTETTETTPGKPTTQGVETTTNENRCRGLPEGTFLPVIGDCTKYVVCDKGREKVGQCPDGTIWDEYDETCQMGSC